MYIVNKVGGTRCLLLALHLLTFQSAAEMYIFTPVDCG